jgi:hypothetical protein
MDMKCGLLPTRKKIELQIFERKVLRKVLGPKKDDISECIWMLGKEKLCEFYWSKCTSRQIQNLNYSTTKPCKPSQKQHLSIDLK